MQATTHKKNYNEFPPEIKNWLKERTLSDETIERFQLHWNGTHIVIPVFDRDGNLLFNKYRRSPLSEDGPKYRYEKGAGSVLYNISTLKDASPDEPIFIVEGELDAIALENIGIRAVTTTGGAGTFEQDWVKEFERFNNVVICFDNDVAGIRGSINVQSMMPEAYVLVLPSFDGKDVTDFLKGHDRTELLEIKAEKYPIPTDVSDNRDKKEVNKKIREFKSACDTIQEMKRAAIKERQVVTHLDVMLEYLSNRYALYSRTARSLKRRPYAGGGNDVAAAKQVPITNLIEFKRGYAPCVWHNEKTASMFYNGERSKFPNTVKCFGCGAMGDPIDVVMQMQGIEFNDAVKYLLGN